MLQRPSATVVGVPPWARTIPAARLLAPSPTRPCSITMTRSAPEVRAKYDAHPPIVPAPTTTRSARSAAIFPSLCPVLSRVRGIKLVGEELRRVVLPLELEERIHTGIRPLQLIGTVVQL